MIEAINYPNAPIGDTQRYRLQERIQVCGFSTG